MEKGQAVVITTDKRGVFFGHYESEEGGSITVTQGRNCIYWSTTTRGFLGLAANGPDSDCKIGPAVPRLHLKGVTSISECTKEAVNAWEKAPWKK